MKQIPSIILCFVLLWAVAVLDAPCATGAELSIPALKGKAGQSIDIPIMIDLVDNLAGIKLKLEYDPAVLVFKKSAKSKETFPFLHVVNDRKPGILIVAMAGAKGIKGRDFPLLLLTFEIKKPLNNITATTIKFSEIQLMDDQLHDIKYSVKTAPLYISP